MVIMQMKAECGPGYEVSKMKETYATPEMEVVEFETEDVITTSSIIPDDNELPIV